MQLSKLILILLFLGSAGAAKAQTSELAFSRNARTYETVQSSLTMKGVAHACLAMSFIPDSLPCNPAMIANKRKSYLSGSGLLSNGYSTLSKMTKLLKGEINDELIQTLFSKERVMQIEGNAEISFASTNVGGRYTPYSIKYFSVIRNEANADIDLYALDEKSLTLQGGSYLFTKGFQAGVQMRFVERKYIRQRFKLISLGTEEGKDRLKPKTERAIYLEPGVAYTFGRAWKYRLGAMVVNSGFVTQDHPDLKTPVDPQIGFAVAPPMPWGRLEIELAYRGMNYEETPLEKLRLGANYNFGGMYVVTGVDGDGVSAGVYQGLDQMNAGILYSTTNVPWNPKDYYAQTVYLQLGVQL